MAINRNIWRPDTCECEIEYEWDGAIDPKDRIHTAAKFTPCAIHASISDKHLCYDAVLKENQLKNKVYGELLKDPDLTVDYVDMQGNFRKRLKNGVKFQWFFDNDRKLNIQLTGVDVSKKAALEALFTQVKING